MKKILLIVILSFLQLGVVTVSSAQPEKKALAIAIMEKSGINEYIRQIPLTYSTMLSKGEYKLPPEFHSILERETVEALDPERILKEISRQTENSLDIRSLQAVFSWFESDLGQKITAMKKSSTTPEEIQGMAEFAVRLKNTPASKNRSNLMQRFIKASSLEAEVDIQISIALAFATAMNSALPEKKRADIGMIKKAIEAVRPQLLKEVRDRAITSNLYTYRALKDQELRHYIEFAESESGKRYNRVILLALKDTMERVSFDFAKALVDVLRKFPCWDETVSSGEIFVHMKNGGNLTWNNYRGKDDWCCTWLAYGESCVKKNDISSIEPR